MKSVWQQKIDERIARIAAHIEEAGEPVSLPEISDALGIPEVTMRDTLRRMRGRVDDGRPRIIRIGAWRPCVGRKGSPAALYVLGEGRDAPRPKSDPKEHGRRYREKYRMVLLYRKRAERRPVSVWEQLGGIGRWAHV
jgi:hypothetical protein